jgi:serine/threonine-protein kinase
MSAWILGVVVVSVALGLAVWSLMRPRAAVTRAVTRSVIALPGGTQLLDYSAFAFSPDGRTAVFAAEDSGRRLYLRPLNSLGATPIAGTDGGLDPFFSPDGRWVGFWGDNKIKKIAVSGGAPLVVCDAAGIGVNAPVWGEDETIVFASTSGAGLLRVSANGGTPQVLTTPNRGEREKTHRLPEVLPGGKAVVMTVGTADITSFDDARIEAFTIATGERKVLIRGGMNARYVSSGHLVYARSGSLLAVPFDVNRLEVTGPPVALVDDVFMDPASGIADFAISHDGSLLFASGGAAKSDGGLLWVDRQGRSEAVTDARRPFNFPRLSPDGQRIAVTIDGATSEIWVYDLIRTTAARLVYGWDNGQSVWSPDGARLAFNSNSGTSGGRNLFWRAADGTGEAERLTPDALVFQSFQSWSPDGRFLVFTQNDPETKADLWILSVQDHKSRPLLRTPASELNANISPDGRWVAYQSNQSGRPEVYVQAFPGPSRNWQVSPDGGSFPVWARNGRELFYRNAGWMMATDITAASEFAAGRPKRLFDASPFANWFDVARDGRFLMTKMDKLPPITHLNLVQNWAEELKARVPTK